MKKFSFRLQKILDLKRIREQEAQRELGTTLRDLNEREDELNTAIGIKASFDARFHEIGREGAIDTIFFRRFQGYQVALQKDIQQQQDQVLDQEETVNEARHKFQLAKRQTETLEKLEQGAKSSYWTEVNREEQNWMSEVALSRFRRHRESGNIALMLMAVGSIAFVLSLLTVGLLFLTGALDTHRARLIRQIMRYDASETAIHEHHADEYKADMAEEQKLQAYLIKGDKKPYFILKADYDRMKEKADKYDLIVADDVDEEVVITQEVHQHRLSLLHRYERAIQSTHDRTASSKEDAEKKLEEAEAFKKQAEMERQNFSLAKQNAAKAKQEKGMDDLLQSFNSMDPEAIIKVLTAGREPTDYSSTQGQQATAEKVSSYMIKMSARKRAGVLEALSPEWSALVLPKLEGTNTSL